MTWRFNFRLWDLENKRMIFPGDEICQEIYFDGEPWETNDILMQSTGLTDKNSKEIYEYDLVKSDKYNLGIIKFGAHDVTSSNLEDQGVSYGWYIEYRDQDMDERKTESFASPDDSKMDYILGKINRGAKCLEVVGNIYENNYDQNN